MFLRALRNTDSLSWKFLLLALFLVVQSLAATHEAAHAEPELQEDICIICHSADNSPALHAGPLNIDDTEFYHAAILHDEVVCDANEAALLFAARAPPHAL